MRHVSTYSFFSNETRMTVNIMLSLFILTLSDTTFLHPQIVLGITPSHHFLCIPYTYFAALYHGITHLYLDIQFLDADSRANYGS